ncbi:MAG TPA: hypothetical protein VJK09_03455 [Candidatus Paceibacterota bacterium]
MRKAVIKVDNEKSQGPSVILRQFSKRVSGSGILRTARGSRYHERSQSDLSRKRSALKRIEKRHAMAKLIKQGKAPILKKRRF